MHSAEVARIRRIVELDDDRQIAPMLESQRAWAAYALCDLEAPHRQHARFIGAVTAGRVTAVVLVYTPAGFTSVLPSGEPEDVAAILAETRDLPTSPLLIVQSRNRAAVEIRYRVDHAWTMLRMLVQADSLRPVTITDAAVVLLTPNHLNAARALYNVWPDTVFTPFMFEHGIYYGAYREGALVAVAGTHAMSSKYRIGVIGNVFTHPDHRGRGLAAAVTGAVAGALFAGGAHDVALNVRDDNAAAIAAYSRLGFQVDEPFWEAKATLHA
jgi:RimJ/RimL family protein N-acetyltransferase